MEKKICLSIDQMQKLKELGISTKDASMCWIRGGEGNRTAELHDEYCYEISFMHPVPAFTLQDMLDIMPTYVYQTRLYDKQFSLGMEKFDDKYKFSYWSSLVDELMASSYQENAIDAAFELLCLLAENNLLKNERTI